MGIKIKNQIRQIEETRSQNLHKVNLTLIESLFALFSSPKSPQNLLARILSVQEVAHWQASFFHAFVMRTKSAYDGDENGKNMMLS